MSRGLDAALAANLAAGCELIGEIMIRSTEQGFALRHHQDGDRADVAGYTRAEDARQLAQFDEAGNFRPLKSAPTLRRGWELRVPDVPALRQALDGFYPAMLGVLLSHVRGELRPVPLRETLARQTGMYAVTKKATDAEAQATIGTFCTSRGKCLKTILWRVSPGQPVTSLPTEKFDPAANQLNTPAQALPLLCHEACNLLVARLREVVKAR